ncbi:metalloregulator ArsR/SmtB family transcription factor [Natroniella sulfidigena]|uniref:ArsR/SmtB family transcription factor n=1 Tax=Natroniella sulfidigena TaxID=723921 RepID=UPI00200B3550|nr:metalloregulator ArsR/SmtB family transcription factor [Natroniella sulfidigena]MCK8818207.1 metalloregulator ArsR/SmtB family transcription factor [Natroniella sulfidigena]
MCKVLAHAKRIEIIYLLKEGEKNVDQLAKTMGISRANTSQHLAILREQGVVCTRKDGLNVYYNICNPKLIKAYELMKEILLENLSELVTTSQEILEKENEDN